MYDKFFSLLVEFRRATSISDLPMAMRFRHLKETAKEAVGVYRYVMIRPRKKKRCLFALFRPTQNFGKLRLLFFFFFFFFF